MKQYLEILWTFSKIGAFTLGGGYAMIPLIQKEVVEKKKWITDDEFTDLIALAQSAPGILAVNMAIIPILILNILNITTDRKNLG